MILAMILGRMKLPLAKGLHEKTLHADATMNKDDWLTGGAAILGILGISWWWADAVAAAFISLEVISDGVTNVRSAMSDLMDQEPTSVENDKPLHVAQHLCEEVRRLHDVADADVRLREEGHVFSGELFVVLRNDRGLQSAVDVARRLQELAAYAQEIDWRLYNLVVMPVETLDPIKTLDPVETLTQ